jgi:hypothetical protein
MSLREETKTDSDTCNEISISAKQTVPLCRDEAHRDKQKRISISPAYHMFTNSVYKPEYP